MNTRIPKLECPMCGKKTRHVTRYRDGTSLFIHEQKLVENPFPHMKIIEACGYNPIAWLE